MAQENGDGTPGEEKGVVLAKPGTELDTSSRRTRVGGSFVLPVKGIFFFFLLGKEIDVSNHRTKVMEIFFVFPAQISVSYGIY